VTVERKSAWLLHFVAALPIGLASQLDKSTVCGQPSVFRSRSSLARDRIAHSVWHGLAAVSLALLMNNNELTWLHAPYCYFHGYEPGLD